MNRRTREETLERVLEEISPGRSYAEVARTLGLSRSWVSELLSGKDAGAKAAAAAQARLRRQVRGLRPRLSLHRALDAGTPLPPLPAHRRDPPTG